MYRFLTLFLFLLATPLSLFAAVLTDPNAAGHPTTVIYDNSVQNDTTVKFNNSVKPTGGVIEKTEVKPVEKKQLREPIILNLSGIGDTCTVGTPTITDWRLAPDAAITNKDELREVLETAVVNDTRLREVSVIDNRLDLYYLMPAYRLKFIPVNYHLHIIADGNTFQMSLENPDWVKNVPNRHGEVSAAFGTEIPTLINADFVASLAGAPLVLRDAKLVEVITTVMRSVTVMPHGGGFFSCYIMPFLAYIIGAVILALLILWYMIRRVRRMHRRRKFLGLSGIGGDENEEDDDEHAPKVHYVPGRPDQ
jgi:hypothetical protein